MEDRVKRVWAEVQILAERFRSHETHYLSAAYQEAQVRKDFLDKFFTALGWDVDHNREPDPWRQEVKIEKPEHKARGRADYSFAIAPHFKRVRFFAEAKRPLSRIDTPDNCFQAIRYSWPKGVPIAVLTDFRSFHVIDSRYKPNISTATSRVVRSWHYGDFADDKTFAQIYWLLSREAVAGGSIENFAANELPTPRVAARQYTLAAGEVREFDDEFLQTLDDWRDDLASNFRAARTTLNGDQLTECVQRTIDRLLFIRFLEDKLIEPDPIVAEFGSRRHTHWKDFIVASIKLDRAYNGIVFKHHRVLDDGAFEPRGDVFANICDELSDQHSPYNFDSIPVEILGRIYERFLGKVVRLRGVGVSVEEKPDVRKAGGVYYTPDYIVAYMAEQALAPMLDGKKPDEIAKLKIIDSACGSGSFLIGAYGVLLQALLRYWTKRPTGARRGMTELRDGQVHLTLKYRREMLVGCIFGIDIDPQAVEVAQLSLYLKLLEDETTFTARQQQLELGAALLPSLAANIVVANSLLATNRHSDLFAEGDTKAIDIKRTFSAAFRSGGFDLVIGNPPYIKEYTNREAFAGTRESPYYEGKMDIWYMFACIGLDWLKPMTGTLAYIATNNWLTNAGAKKLRSKIAREARIEQLIDFADFKVFRDAGIQTMILIVRKNSTGQKYTFDYRRIVSRSATQQDAVDTLEMRQIGGARYLAATFDRSKDPTAPLSFVSSDIDMILDKIAAAANFSLNGREEIAQGIVAPQDRLNAKGQARLGSRFAVGQGIFVLTDDERGSLRLTKDEKELIKPYFTPAQLGRYFGSNQNEFWIIYTDSSFADGHSMDRLPNLKRHLDQFAPVITSHNKPYGLHRARVEQFFMGPKIAAVRKCTRPTFTYTDFPCYLSQTFNVIKSNRVDLVYLTGLLNSRLVRVWLMHRGKRQGHNFQIDKEPLLAIPLHVPSLAKQHEVGALVRKAIALEQQQRDPANTDAQRLRLQTRTNYLVEAIDDEIEPLYGLRETDRELLASLDEDLPNSVADSVADSDGELDSDE